MVRMHPITTFRLVDRVRERLPGRAETSERSSKDDEPVVAKDDRGSASAATPRPGQVAKRPRTPRHPDANAHTGMWPDLWAAHRC
jgi:hypothetical protein